ncbi:hypothetical protein DdX_17736 [Ditylenchus destructor]|uniref:Uncharacterized protein n=1 Tax=Ditylenchus destructor TaxID=166010 RepID=A0AAD4MLW9_9BILA|nr:hypothetical protein DdX_17736 [Ditylenchus destructor]
MLFLLLALLAPLVDMSLGTECIVWGIEGSTCGMPEDPNVFDGWCCGGGLKCEMVDGYGTCVRDSNPQTPPTEKPVTVGTVKPTTTGLASNTQTQPPTEKPVTVGTVKPTTTGPADHCDVNEHYEKCPKCPEWTCSQIRPLRNVSEGYSNRAASNGTAGGPNDRCATEDHAECLGKSDCYCNLGHARNEKTGKCILKEECHIDCGANAHFEKCPQWKDNKCEELKKPKIPTSKYTSNYCLQPGCRCDKGHARGKDGTCMKIGDKECITK